VEFFLEKQVAAEYLFTEIILYMVDTLNVISQCLFCMQEAQGLFGYHEMVSVVESFSA
jgi:hypothetical protein